jgi:hypothetical protein
MESVHRKSLRNYFVFNFYLYLTRQVSYFTMPAYPSLTRCSALDRCAFRKLYCTAVHFLVLKCYFLSQFSLCIPSISTSLSDHFIGKVVRSGLTFRQHHHGRVDSHQGAPQWPRSDLRHLPLRAPRTTDPMVPVKVDGHDTEALLDSGSVVTLVAASLIAQGIQQCGCFLCPR